MDTFRKRVAGAVVLSAVSVMSIAAGGVMLGTASAETPAPSSPPHMVTFTAADMARSAGSAPACVVAFRGEAGAAAPAEYAPFEVTTVVVGEAAPDGFVAGARVEGMPAVEAKPLSSEDVQAMLESGQLIRVSAGDCQVIDLDAAATPTAP